ncbi:MAG: ABC transporter ATP-binding protein [Kiritimatiellae bacterium]|nr:ABC transporter ATP-binding protein [Kiritimatiellia bacterium]
MKVELLHLTRVFQRGFKAVDDLSFSFTSGEVVGFVGPNGAGKTTTMRMLATLDVPDSGDILIDGKSILDDPALAHRAVGFMPDDLPNRSDTTVDEYLDFFGRAYGLRGKELADAINGVEDFTGLVSFRDKTLRELSKGMKQRVSLARALVHDPQVIVMDEPANGLDPRARIELRELVRALAEQGKAILISSHILSELEEMCTTSVIIERGRRLSTDFKDETAWIRLKFNSEGGEAILAKLLEMPSVKEAELSGAGFRVRIDAGDDAAESLAKELFAKDLVPIHFTSEAGRLEDVFMHVTKGALA